MQHNSSGHTKIRSCLYHFPVIAAVHNREDIHVAVQSRANILFLMHGDIFDLEPEIAAVRESKKLIFVHIDLVKGVSRDDSGMRYYASKVKVNGIISTNANIIKTARNEGLMSIMRMFVVDTKAFENSVHTINAINPELVEIMPALIPRAISDLKRRIRRPIIAGGMVSGRQDVESALQAGAVGVSTSIRELWY